MLSIFGPAILVSVELFNPASIVAATAAGASVGLVVLWAAFYSGIMLIVIQEISARLGVVTGKTLAENIRERYGANFSHILFIPSIFLDMSTLTAEVMGLSLAISFFFKAPYSIAMIVSVLLTTILFNIGSYSKLEKIIMFLVTTIFLIYFYFLLYVNLPLSNIVIDSIIPSFKSNSFYYAEAIIGASIMPTYVILHSGLVYEKGWVHHHQLPLESLEEDRKNIRSERVDSVFGLLMGTVLNIVIIACATAFLSGSGVNNFSDLAQPFGDKLGSFGLTLFTIAFASAGVSAIITVGLASVYNTFGFLGFQERMTKKKFKMTYVIWVIIAGIASLLPNKIEFIVLTQYLNGAMLPFVLIPLVLITRNEKVMGKNKIGVLISAFALATVSITTLLFLMTII